MMRLTEFSQMAIIGGGRLCKKLLDLFDSDELRDEIPQMLGVADLNPEAEGMLAARRRGIFTTTDYRDLFAIKGLKTLLETTRDPGLPARIEQVKPAHVRLIDHVGMRSFWTLLQIEIEQRRNLTRFEAEFHPDSKLKTHFTTFSQNLVAQVMAWYDHYEEIERDFKASKRTAVQIIEGSTIPTFVIDREHVVTHWNKACEQLTGYKAADIIGTRDQWRPFRRKPRPVMADLLLDGVDDATVLKYYGALWQPSTLLEGAFEATEFFPHLGDHGKWLYFTAAPIKAEDGAVTGVIETLWDITKAKEAEAERAASHQMTAQIIAGSTIPTFVINKKHVITHWNLALERLTGYSAVEMVGTRKQWLPFWGRERPAMADVIVDGIPAEEIEKLYGGRWRKSNLISGAYEAESFFPKLGNSGKWCWFTAAPIKDADGRTVGAVETLWDKTDDKKVEEERERHTWELNMLCTIYTALGSPRDINGRIREALKQVGQLLSADGVSVYLKDEQGALRHRHGWQTRYQPKKIEADQFVYTQNCETEMTLFEDVHRPNGSADLTALKKVGVGAMACVPLLAREKAILGTIKIYFKEPRTFSDEEKRVLELVGNRLTVALENAQLQQALIKSDKKYRSLFNNDPNPIFIIAPQDYRIVDVNQRARDSYGYPGDELVGISFFDLGDDEEEMHQKIGQVRAGHPVLFAKKRHYRKGKRPFYVNINISAAKYGETDALIATTTDISEAVEKETQLIQASKMTTLGQMASGMAHEINQPLNVIQITSDLLVKMVDKGIEMAPDDIKALANDIRASVNRAAGIIRHMRDFSRQSDVVAARIDLNAPIRDVFNVMGHQVTAHQVKLDLDLAGDLPEIMADHNRLEQVFINLVTNAIDAMDEKAGNSPETAVEKTLTIRSFQEDGKVVATVADTGAGMPREVMDKIFDPFFTTKKVGKGTGLGVSISYGIVKDYKGDITIESKPGKGTTFRLSFPACVNQECVGQASIKQIKPDA